MKQTSLSCIARWIPTFILFFLFTGVNAQLGPGWKEYFPTKKIHLDDDAGLQTFNWTSYKSVCTPICADYSYDAASNSETFRILSTKSNRSEIRLQNEYSTGSRQFEGYVTFNAPLDDESLMQIFGSTSGATQLMVRGYAADGGSIRGGGKTLATNVYGRELKINVIHLQEDAGNKIQVYVDNVKMVEIADNEAVTNYQKYGNYGTMRTGEAVVKWRNVRVFRDGTAPDQAGVLITSPATGAQFNAPANIAIAASAFDQGGITKVEFFNGAVKLGEDTSNPYSFNWANVAAGSYTLQAKATTGQGQVMTSATVNITVNSAQAASFDITDNGGVISAQYPNTTKPSEDYPSLIDNNKSTKYYRSGRTVLWVQYKSPVPAIVVKYTITSANDVPNRDPRDWNLQGSNNGSTWTTLDSRTGQTFASRFLTKTYSFTNTTSYTYYRLNITANNGETGTQFAEWELYEKRNQAISFDAIPGQTYGDDPFKPVATASSGLPVVFSIVSGPAAIGADGFVTMTGAGTVTIRASQAGDDNYFPAATEQVFIVNKAQQDIDFEPVGTKTYGDAPFALDASVDTHLPLEYSVVSGPASVAGNVLTITGAGEVTVRASQAGNENYLPAVAEQTFVVNKATQTISFAAIAPKNRNETVTLSAASSAGLPVSFGVVSGPGSVTGNTLSFTGQGNVTIQAQQVGDQNYLPATPVSQVVLVYAEDEKKDGIKLVVFPNPTHGPLKVKLDNKKDKQYTISVYNDKGKLVASAVTPKSFKMFEVDFNITDTNGFYYIYVSDGEEVVVRQVLKY